MGCAGLRPHLTATQAEMVAFYVSRAYHRQGIATALLQEIIRLAHAAGAREIYVSAVPSESAVGFYLSQGFRLAPHPNPGLFALEPNDIHMLLPLADRLAPP